MTKTVCIGNLSVGGTGKTPMVEWLIALFGEHYKVAVLSRGYKRKSTGFYLATAESTLEELGDEPFQIFSKHPEISVAVDANRRNGITNLENKRVPDVILMDDAFQHRYVKPSYSILLTAYNDLYVHDWYLPTGNLRDSKKEARRAQIIVVTKCPENLDQQKQSDIREQLKPRAGQEVLFAYFEYSKTINGEGSIRTMDALLKREVTLVTGIANPKPLLQYLNNEGVQLDHMAYSDHHFFTPAEIKELNGKECILTTEKDYVRLKGKVKNLYYISVKHKFLGDGGLVLEKELTKLMQ